MMVSDAENYYLLKHCPERMREMGLNKLVLAPNILGESLLYLSFAILSNSWMTVFLLLATWIALFYPINATKRNTIKETIQEFEEAKRYGVSGGYFTTFGVASYEQSLEGVETASSSGSDSGAGSDNSRRKNGQGAACRWSDSKLSEGDYEGASAFNDDDEVSNFRKRRSSRLSDAKNSSTRDSHKSSKGAACTSCENKECSCDICSCDPCCCGRSKVATVQAPRRLL